MKSLLSKLILGLDKDPVLMVGLPTVLLSVLIFAGMQGIFLQTLLSFALGGVGAGFMWLGVKGWTKLVGWAQAQQDRAK